MKKAIIFFIMGLFCLNFSIIQQIRSQEEVNSSDDPLSIWSFQVGDKLPEDFWQQERVFCKDGKTLKHALSIYKDKLLIIDFLSVQNEKYLDSLQKQYDGRLVLLHFNSRNEQPISKENDPLLKPLGNEYNTTIDNILFNGEDSCHPQPRYMWISKGIFIALTADEFVQKYNIEAILQQ